MPRSHCPVCGAPGYNDYCDNCGWYEDEDTAHHHLTRKP
jgi:hypothetical protein